MAENILLTLVLLQCVWLGVKSYRISTLKQEIETGKSSYRFLETCKNHDFQHYLSESSDVRSQLAMLQQKHDYEIKLKDQEIKYLKEKLKK